MNASNTMTLGPRSTRRLLLQDIDQPRQFVSNITPNWFASVMGTGIVANAAATLPLIAPALRLPATLVWMLAALLLVGLILATAAHWIWFPGRRVRTTRTR